MKNTPSCSGVFLCRPKLFSSTSSVRHLGNGVVMVEVGGHLSNTKYELPVNEEVRPKQPII